jgi:predicted Zn finger-like uncharacterized protein
MKIVCEACQAKYSIADEKVRGKVFKIRCKKCSHVIVVRGGGSAETGSAPSAEFASSPSSAPDLALDAGWHIVVDGEQVGPLSEGDIRARLARGEINPETYIWKEGLPDWVKVSTLPEFRGEGEIASPFSGAPADDGYAAATVVSNSPGADVFGAASAGSAGSAGGVGADLFGSPVAAEAVAGRAAAGGGGYGSFDSPSAPDPFASMSAGNGAGGGGVASSMTGQRHENSVLFSLSNLEALAKPSTAAPLPSLRSPGATSPSTTTTTEGSGLIDIRAMANMTLGSSSAKSDMRGPDLPAFSAPQFSPVAPVLLSPGHGGGMPRWAIVSLLAGVGVLALFLAVVAVKLLTAPPPPVAQAPAPAAAAAPAAAQAPPAAAQAPPSTPPPAANEELPPREPSKPVATTADRDDRKSSRSGSSSRRSGSRSGEGERASGAVTPTPRATAEAPAAPARKKDDIDSLLEQATGSKRGGGSAAAAPRREEEEPKAERLPPLPREEVVKGMNAVLPRARDCYNQYKVPGLAMVKLTVAPSGRVSAATVTGKFAGTPSGTCVESAVKSAKFAPSAGLTFDYPVPLR